MYRALLIEDNPGDVRIVREMLAAEPQKLRLIDVRTLAEGLQRLARENFDAAVVDLGLPDCRGIETFARLHDCQEKLPIIVLTGTDDVELALHAVQAGAQDYLVKSQINGAQLLRSVQYAIERKRAEEAVRESESRFRHLFESAKDGMLIVDGDSGIVTAANSCFVDLFGYGRNELVGRQLADIPPLRFIASEEIESVRTSDVALDLQLQTRDGRRIDCEFISNRYSVDGHSSIQCNIRDVTARKRALRLYAVLSLVNQAVVRTREVPRLYEGVCRIAVETGNLDMAWVGMTEESGRVKPVAHYGRDEGYLDLTSVSSRDDASGAGPTGRAIRENKPQLCNDWKLDPRMNTWREEGTRRGYRSSAALPLYVNGRVIGALTLYSGEPDFFSEDEMRLLETLTADLAFAIESIERNEQRQAAEAAVREMNAELEERIRSRTEALVAANQELEAFTYSVSHDLRAPLRAIDGFSRLLAASTDPGITAETKDYLQRICAATNRMSNLIDDLLALSRIGRQELHVRDVDLSALARTIAAELRETDPSRDVEFLVGENIHAQADEGLMRIVLQNLLNNAWKFTSKQPAARIEFGTVEAQAGRTFFVRDNGVGFDPQYAGKLFAPFQRLHTTNEFEGNGIGLATVQRAIGRHGGHVLAKGEAGSGATFFFTLP